MGTEAKIRRLVSSSEGADRQAASGDNLCATNSCPSKVTIYLTFDDGPKPSGTPEVLDVLRGEGVKATFFLNYVQRRELTEDAKYRLVKRILQEGHALGNHGLDHDPYKASQYKDTSNIGAVRSDFVENIAKFKELFTNSRDSFPGFSCARLAGAGKDFPNYVSVINNDLRMIHVSWNNEFAPMDVELGHLKAYDWQRVNGVKAEFPSPPKDQDIMLLHDAHWARSPGLLHRLISKLKETSTIAPELPLSSSR